MNRAIGNNVTANLAPTFTADTAARTGQSERSVQRDATRGAMLPAPAGAGLGKAIGRAPASPTTRPKTICRSRAGQYAIARHPRAGHAPVRCHGRMRPHAGFPDQRLFHADTTWMNRHFANKPHLVHELAPLYPKNRRKPQGTASGLRFFRAANSTIYLQFS